MSVGLPINAAANELAKATTCKQIEESSLSTHNHSYKVLWQGLHAYMSNRKGVVAPPVVSDLNYVKFPPMLRGFRLCAAFNTEEPSRKVKLLITGKKSGDYALLLKPQCAEIEAKVGCGLDWNIELKGDKKVSLWDHGIDIFAGLATDHFAWYGEKLELLHSVFAPRIRQVASTRCSRCQLHSQIFAGPTKPEEQS